MCFWISTRNIKQSKQRKTKQSKQANKQTKANQASKAKPESKQANESASKRTIKQANKTASKQACHHGEGVREDEREDPKLLLIRLKTKMYKLRVYIYT